MAKRTISKRLESTTSANLPAHPVSPQNNGNGVVDSQASGKNAKLYTRAEANNILAERYPTDEELERFPLGHLLIDIPQVNERYGQQANGKPGHIRNVVKGMNILLGDTPHKIVKQWDTNERDHRGTIEFTTALRTILGVAGVSSPDKLCRLPPADFQPFFRLCVVYHDIGKYIIHERHPNVGWHLIRDVYQDEVERELYPFLLGISYEEWKTMKLADLSAEQKQLISLFENVIRYHDLFGVLSTGEASLPVMTDLVRVTGTNPRDAKEMFSILMLFNLADLYGSVDVVHPYKVVTFCKDWEILCNAIDEAKGDRHEFFQILLEKAQAPEMTVERIKRFMNEEAPAEWQGRSIDDKMLEVFAVAVLAGMHSFCRNFALFCKLDYALAFKKKIMDTAKLKSMEVTKPMAKIMWLLAQLEKQYGDLCRRKDGTWRRLGLEMAGLNRKPSSGRDRDKSKIGDTISELLLNTEEKGKEWAAGECTVWFMEE